MNYYHKRILKNNKVKISAFICFLFLICNIGVAQKGATPIGITINATSEIHNTYAVVVGISDYQDNNIPDLKYADRDAIAFVEWLKSKGGGESTDDHIVLLTNEKATRAQLDAALSWLIEKTKEGDDAIIYFSGHGDVETKTKFNRGFLLCYDSPSNNYAAGAFHLSYLQDVITTLSEKKIKTVIITDACHAGKLAGSSVGGSQATAASLNKQFANEIKILSCQPNEYSIEGEQWGGGRGVFSYYLIDGLYGFADTNSDGLVNLMELSRFLQDRVSKDALPASQIPIINGNLIETIAKINQESFALQKQRANRDKRILSVQEFRGIEVETLSKVDSMTRKKFYDFKGALSAKNFFYNKDSQNLLYADTLFLQLIQNKELLPLHSTMQRNYTATLQDVVQQALNALLADDPYEFNNWYINPEKYAEYPKYLSRAIELIGKDHISYPLLYSQQKYFEAYYLLKVKLTEEINLSQQDSIKSIIKTLLITASEYSPDAAYIYHALANLYWNKHNYSTDSLEKYCNIAIKLAPNWMIPYHILADEYLNTSVDIPKTETLIYKGLQYKPDSYLLNLLLAWTYQKKYKHKEADSICFNLIKLKPELFNAWSTMVQTHSELMDWNNVIKYSEISLKLEPSSRNWSWGWYINALLNCKREADAMKILHENIEMNTFNSNFITEIMADYYFKREHWLLAEKFNNEVITSSQSELHIIANALIRKGIYLFKKGMLVESEIIFKDAINKDPTPDAADHIGRCWLAKIEEQKGNIRLADSLFLESFKYPKNIIWAHEIGHSMYGDFLLNQNRDLEAVAQYNKSIELIPLDYQPYFGLSRYYAKSGDKKVALDFLEKALDRYYPIPDPIYREPLFGKIRKTKRFKEMMMNNFGPN